GCHDDDDGARATLGERRGRGLAGVSRRRTASPRLAPELSLREAAVLGRAREVLAHPPQAPVLPSRATRAGGLVPCAYVGEGPDADIARAGRRYGARVPGRRAARQSHRRAARIP